MHHLTDHLTRHFMRHLLPLFMRHSIPRLLRVLCSALLLFGIVKPAFASNLSAEDQRFIELRQAAHNNDVKRAQKLANTLRDYDIPSYVEYFQIKPKIFDADGQAKIDAPDQEMEDFIQARPKTALADRMRNDWLLVLGKRRDWEAFDALYPKFVLNDDTQVKCYALLSQIDLGENVANDARKLLTEPKNYGEGCVDLITSLAAAGQFSANDVWAQMRLASEGKFFVLAKKIGRALGAACPEDFTLDMAAKEPERFLKKMLSSALASKPELFLLALDNLARTQLAIAQTLFEQYAKLAGLTAEQRKIGWGQLGFYAMQNGQFEDAIKAYRLSGNVELNPGEQEWRTRAALYAGDWNWVKQSIDAMTNDLNQQSVWVYWYGRALETLGQPKLAAEKFKSISSQFNFYGQLALEALGKAITLPPAKKLLNKEAQIEAMAKNAGFQRAQKFYAMGLRFEGNREWNWELRFMDDEHLLMAAEYARRIGLFDRTINTAEKTRSEYDFGLRYLMPFRKTIESSIQSSGLDIAWVYGLMRQESRFVTSAQSSAGAGGLMQLIPATAARMARRVGISKFSPQMLSDVRINTMLGCSYLEQLYKKFDGSLILASAGYNAGPSRPNRWQSQLNHAVEGAVFAEIIPFKETRNYVKNVLSNTVYYAADIENKPQSLLERLGTIAPSGRN